MLYTLFYERQSVSVWKSMVSMASQHDKDVVSPESSGFKPAATTTATNLSSGLKRQGSIRKVLPVVPDTDTQLSMHAVKMIERRTSYLPRDGSQGYIQFFLEYSLLAEYGLLKKQKLPGIYVTPAAKTPLVWFGVMFIRQGLYQGGVFRFTINIPANYPDGECPGIVFETPVFHPQINYDSGILDVTKGFKKWRRNVNHIWHLLLYARHIFYKIDPGEPSNSDATNLFENDLELYRNKVSECIRVCAQRLYDAPTTDDPYSIRFSKWDPQLHGELRNRLFNRTTSERDSSPRSAPVGLSWVKKGSLQIFSKDKNES